MTAQIIPPVVTSTPLVKPHWRVTAYKGWIYAKGFNEAEAIEVYRKHFAIQDGDTNFKPIVEPRK